MSFLIGQIREQKLLDADVAISDFIERHGISEAAMIFEVILDKSIYKTEQEAREYLRDKFYTIESLGDSGTIWTAIVLNKSQLNLDSTIEIEIRRGVKVKAADLKVIPQDVFFGCQLPTFDLSIKDMEISLSEGIPHIIEVCTVIEGFHPRYGNISIKQEHLESMLHNFNSGIVGLDLAINEDHKKNEAFGWLKEVFLSVDKQTLYGCVIWNTNGTTALAEKKYRYFSPEFRFDFTDPHTGEEHGPTLFGGALTNYPFLKMDAITELNQKPSEENVTTQTIDLADHQAQVINLNGKIKELELAENSFKGTIAGQKTQITELSAKVDTLEKDAKRKEVEVVNQKLFDANKINKAQLVALNEGKSATEVIELATKMNSGKGTSTGTDTNTSTSVNENNKKEDDIVELSDKDRDMARKCGLSDKEYYDANKDYLN